MGKRNADIIGLASLLKVNHSRMEGTESALCQICEWNATFHLLAVLTLGSFKPYYLIFFPVCRGDHNTQHIILRVKRGHVYKDLDTLLGLSVTSV